MIKTVVAKLGGMRKPQTFVIYPRKSAAEPMVVQSEKAIGKFDPATGVGVLNAKGQNPKYFIHLMTAEPFTFPPEFVAACVAAGAVTPDGSILLVAGC